MKKKTELNPLKKKFLIFNDKFTDAILSKV